MKSGHTGLKKQGVAHSVLGKQTEVRTANIMIQGPHCAWFWIAGEHEQHLTHRMSQHCTLLDVSWDGGNLALQDLQKTS